ncbi:hypothetical protein FA13DRAFT_1733482, partial [Coprinellus micaceus]
MNIHLLASWSPTGYVSCILTVNTGQASWSNTYPARERGLIVLRHSEHHPLEGGCLVRLISEPW